MSLYEYYNKKDYDKCIKIVVDQLLKNNEDVIDLWNGNYTQEFLDKLLSVEIIREKLRKVKVYGDDIILSSKLIEFKNLTYLNFECGRIHNYGQFKLLDTYFPKLETLIIDYTIIRKYTKDNDPNSNKKHLVNLTDTIYRFNHLIDLGLRNTNIKVNFTIPHPTITKLEISSAIPRGMFQKIRNKPKFTYINKNLETLKDISQIHSLNLIRYNTNLNILDTASNLTKLNLERCVFNEQNYLPVVRIPSLLELTFDTCKFEKFETELISQIFVDYFKYFSKDLHKISYINPKPNYCEYERDNYLEYNYDKLKISPVEDYDLEYISKLTHLRVLIIKDETHLNGSGVSHLSSLVNLEKISVSSYYNSKYIDKLLEVLSNNCNNLICMKIPSDYLSANGLLQIIKLKNLMVFIRSDHDELSKKMSKVMSQVLVQNPSIIYTYKDDYKQEKRNKHNAIQKYSTLQDRCKTILNLPITYPYFTRYYKDFQYDYLTY